MALEASKSMSIDSNWATVAFQVGELGDKP